MEEIVIGKTRIPVEVKENAKLKRSRLSVDHKGVLVETPKLGELEEIVSFVEDKREWIFNRWEESKGRTIQNVWPERFVSGAKVMFLGRPELLEINRGPDAQITFSTRGFQVSIPANVDPSQIRVLIIEYFQSYLHDLIQRLIDKHVSGKVADIRFTRRNDRWAYCDEDKVLHVGWDLAFLPKKLIEYVIKHELCHLTHMDHGPQFWSELKRMAPDYQDHQKMLAEWESSHGL